MSKFTILSPDKEGKGQVKAEAVNHPSHYTALPAVCDQCGDIIECIEVVRWMDFDLGNAVKYIWRAGQKNDILEDLEKARWYIDDKINQIKKERGI